MYTYPLIYFINNYEAFYWFKVLNIFLYIHFHNFNGFANPAAGTNHKYLEARKMYTYPLIYFINNYEAIFWFKVLNIFLYIHFHNFNGVANPAAGMNHKHLEARKMSTGPLRYLNNNIRAF